MKVWLIFIQDSSNLKDYLSQHIDGKEVLFIFDDMINSKNFEYISDLFMVQGRHNRVSLIFVNQMGFRTD